MGSRAPLAAAFACFGVALIFGRTPRRDNRREIALARGRRGFH